MSYKSTVGNAGRYAAVPPINPNTGMPTGSPVEELPVVDEEVIPPVATEVPPSEPPRPRVIPRAGAGEGAPFLSDTTTSETALQQAVPPETIKPQAQNPSDAGFNALSEDSSRYDIAKAAGTQWASPDATRAVYNQETGGFDYQRIGEELYQQQQVADIARRTTFNTEGATTRLGVEKFADSVLTAGKSPEVAERMRKSGEIRSKRDTLSNRITEADYDLFDPDGLSTYDEHAEGEEVAAIGLGEAILKDITAKDGRNDIISNLDEDQRKLAQDNLSTIAAVAPIRAWIQAKTEAGAESSGSIPVRDLINSITSAVSEASSSSNMPLNRRQNQQTAMYSFEGALKAGLFKLVPALDSNGKPIPGEFEVIRTAAGSNVIGELGELAEAITAGTSKMGFSLTPYGQLLGTGPTVTSKSKGAAQKAQTNSKVVNAAKMTLQNVAEKSYKEPSDVYRRMIADIVAGVRQPTEALASQQAATAPTFQWSDSKYAERLKLHSGAWMDFRQEYRPPRSKGAVAEYNKMMTERAKNLKAELGIDLDITDKDPRYPELLAWLADLPTENHQNADIGFANREMNKRMKEVQNTMENALPQLEGAANGLYSQRDHTISNGRLNRQNNVYNPEQSKYDRDIGNLAEQWGVKPDDLLNATAHSKLLETYAAWAKVTELGKGYTASLDKTFTPQEQTIIGMTIQLTVLDDELKPTADRRNYKLFTPTDIIKVLDRERKVFPEVLKQAKLRGKALQLYSQGAEMTPADQELVDSVLNSKFGELGNFQSTVGPLLDVARLQDAKDAGLNVPVQVVGMTAMDGTQNGLALMSILAGNDVAAAKLFASGEMIKRGDFTEAFTFGDLRDQMVDGLNGFVSVALKGQDQDKREAIVDFFDAVKEYKVGGKEVGVDLLTKFMKGPLMEYGYSKDSSMFGSNVADLLGKVKSDTNMNKEYQVLLNKYDGDIDGLRRDVTNIVKIGLENTIEGRLPRAMKKIGRMFGVLNVPFTITGSNGDTWVMAPVEMRDVVKQRKANDVDFGIDEIEYEEAQLRLLDPASGMLETARTQRVGEQRLSPTHIKKAHYWDKLSNSWQEAQNYAGSSQSRQAAVLPIQNSDAALIANMLAHVNLDRMTEGTVLKGVGKVTQPPIPLYTVHDAIYTSYRGLLHYHNAYNNVAVPQLMQWYAQRYVKELFGSLDDARAKVFKDLDNGRGYAGIGAEGEYDGIGGTIDGEWFKYYGPQAKGYKEHAVSTWDGGNQAYQSAKSKFDKVLAALVKLGYQPPGTHSPTKDYEGPTSASEKKRARMTVSAENAKAIIKIVEGDLLQLGPDSLGSQEAKLKEELQANVDRVVNTLRKNKSIRTSGYNQMSL